MDGEEVARAILLFLAGAVVLALVRGGWSGPGGVSDLLAAKFLGNPRPRALAAAKAHVG